MKDYIMTKELTPFEKRVAAMPEAELVAQNTKAMKMLHTIWARVSAEMCGRADDSRVCANAIASGDAREIENMLHVLHAKMDVFAAKNGGVAMPKAGDR